MNIENFDVNVLLFRLINGHHTEFLDRFIDYFHYLGQTYAILVILVVLWFINRALFYRFLLASLITGIFVTLIKIIIAVPRPAAFLDNVILMRPLYRYSFPSGDAAVASVITTFFFDKIKWYFRPFIVLYCLLIYYGRIYFGVHFPLDILGGLLIAVLSVIVSEKLFFQFAYKKKIQ